jgi:hypothetical protein
MLGDNMINNENKNENYVKDLFLNESFNVLFSVYNLNDIVLMI